MPGKIEDFIKGSYGEQVVMLNLVKAGMNTYGLSFGFTQEEIDALIGKITKTITDHDAAEVSKAEAKSATEQFNETRKDTFSDIRATSRRIKSHPAYTVTIGKEIGIVGEEAHYEPSQMQPELKVIIDAGIPKVKFVKSYSEGVNIYSKRGDETEFTFLARDTESPYPDDRANLVPGKPETRQYYAFYIFDDTE